MIEKIFGVSLILMIVAVARFDYFLFVNCVLGSGNMTFLDMLEFVCINCYAGSALYALICVMD